MHTVCGIAHKERHNIVVQLGPGVNMVHECVVYTSGQLGMSVNEFTIMHVN